MRRYGDSNMAQLEFAMRFLVWASTFRRTITRDDVMARWDVSRATAYRYLAAYNRALAGGQFTFSPNRESEQHQVHA